ncbi:MAG: hypothetical protein ACREDZ_03350 [Kiloniellales bacterium]
MSEALSPTPNYDEMVPISRGLRGLVEGVVFYGIVGFGISFPIIAGFIGELIR